MILRDVRKNKIKTYLIFGLFMAFIYLVIYFVGIIFDMSSYIFIIFALVIAFISSYEAYYNSDKIILKLNGAREATKEEDLMLTNILEGLCLATGLPKPRLYIMDDSAMNAFAIGRNPNNAVICVTTGLLNRLEKYEIEAVLAHELSHIKNYDILLQSIAIVMVGFVVIISDIVSRNLYYAGSRDDDNKSNGIIMLIGIVFILLSPFFAELLKLAISRNREYLADSNAVEITRNKTGMINALKKISSDPEELEQAHKSSESLFIVSPLKGKKSSSLFSTHPSIEDRIDRINKLQ